MTIISRSLTFTACALLLLARMFISGDEAPRRFGDALPKAKYDATFPDGAPATILRRGTLSCAGADRSASCRFTLMLPAGAQAAQQEHGAR